MPAVRRWRRALRSRELRFPWPFGRNGRGHAPLPAPLDEEPDAERSAMPLMGHLDELKKRVVRSVLVLVGGTVVGAVFHRQIIEFLRAPADEVLAAGGSETVAAGTLVYTELTGYWGPVMKLAVVTGIALGLPFFIYQIVMFVVPGLKRGERRALLLLIPFALLLFVAGAAFGYYILLPPVFKFLISFGEGVASPLITIGSYLDTTLRLLFLLGLVFELPLVILFLARLGVVSPSWLRRQRRWAILLSFVIGAIITPTFDPVNQLLVAGPIFVLYEIGYWLAKIVYRGRAKAGDAAAGNS